MQMTNTAIDMTDNQHSDFLNRLYNFYKRPDVADFIRKIKKGIMQSTCIKNTYSDTDYDDIKSDITYICVENDCQSEEDFWRLFGQKQNLKVVRKNNRANNKTLNFKSLDGDYNSNSDYYNNNNDIITIELSRTPLDHLITKEETNDAKTKEETDESETKEGAIAIIKMINWLINKVDFKTAEWQEVKKWAIGTLANDNAETRKQAITLKEMTDQEREVWVIVDHYICNDIGNINQTQLAGYVSKVRGRSESRQSYKEIMRRATIKAGIDLTLIKGFTSKAKPKKRANVIPIADFIKHHKQLDFNFNHQESKIAVNNSKKILLYASKAVFELTNKAVNGCSSGGGKESVFSPSANGLNTLTNHKNISSNNINLNDLKINNKKIDSKTKILSINAFIEKNINSKTNSDNNTFCQVISINQGIHHSDQSPLIFNKKSIHKDKSIFKKDKWSSDMFARYGP